MNPADNKVRYSTYLACLNKSANRFGGIDRKEEESSDSTVGSPCPPPSLSPSPLGIAQAAVRGIQGVVVGSQRGPAHGSRCRQGGSVCRFASPRPEPPPTLKQPQTQTFESKAPLPETSTEAVPSSGSAVPRQWWGRGGAANRGGRSGGHWHNRNCPQWLRATLAAKKAGVHGAAWAPPSPAPNRQAGRGHCRQRSLASVARRRDAPT